MQVRLGLGAVDSPPSAKGPTRTGLPEFRSRVESLAEEFATIPAVPVVADLRVSGALGVAGPHPVAHPAAASYVMQLVALHSPAELSLACLTSPAHQPGWSWLEWLPHTGSAHSPIGDLVLASEPATGRAVLSRLEELIDARTEGANGRARGPIDRADDPDEPRLPSVLVVVDDPEVDVTRLTRIAERGPDAGVHVVWVAPEVSRLPGACRMFVECGAAETVRVCSVRHEHVWEQVRVESLGGEAAMELARVLAPMVDAGMPVDDVTDLPSAVSVASLLGQQEIDEPDLVLERWRENRSLVDRSGAPPVPLKHTPDLTAVVGHAGSAPLALDLRGHGPHALVGGTTGAGKREFLQAWVLSLAHDYSPDRVDLSLRRLQGRCRLRGVHGAAALRRPGHRSDPSPGTPGAHQPARGAAPSGAAPQPQAR